MSGTTAQDKSWKDKESAEEAIYIHQKEQAQLAALRESLAGANKTGEPAPNSNSASAQAGTQTDRDFESGFGGQEDLEDRYATTSGEH